MSKTFGSAPSCNVGDHVLVRGWPMKPERMGGVARIAAMTPKERQGEIDRLLGWLSDPKTNTGFMALKVGG